jgi:hypothetical protein
MNMNSYFNLSLIWIWYGDLAIVDESTGLESLLLPGKQLYVSYVKLGVKQASEYHDGV